MAYIPMSQRVAAIQAAQRGETPPETHRIENPRQHDIAQVIHPKEHPAPAPDLSSITRELKNSGPAEKPAHDLTSIAHQLSSRAAEKPSHPDLSPISHELRRSSEPKEKAPDLSSISHDLRAAKPASVDHSAGVSAAARMLQAQNSPKPSNPRISQATIRAIKSRTRPIY